MENESFFRKWGGLLVLSLALAIIIIDTTLLNVSLGNIIRDLHTDIQSLQWVITAYALVLAAFTITGGRLGDLFGRKKMFMIGAIIFAAGSFLASISHTLTPLLLGESIIEGFGAALMMPATASLLVSNFSGRDRAIAFGVWGGVASASAALGPILGGFLTTHYSWRWGFRINIFVTAILLVGATFLVKEAREKMKKIELDWIGVILSSIGLLAVVFGVIESETYGWLKAKEALVIAGHTYNTGNISIVLPVIVLGLLILAAFVWWEMRLEARGHTPLVSMKLFAYKQFTSGTITTGVLGLSQTGIFFTFPIFFQAVKGLDAFHTGIALLPMPIGIFLFAAISAALTGKIRAKRIIQAGFVVSGIGVILLHQALTPGVSLWALAPGLLFYGFGFGLIMPQISNLTLSAIPVAQSGEASGVNNTIRQLGATLGSAIMGAILLTGLATNLTTGIRESAVIPAQAKEQIATAVSKQTSNVEFGGGAHLNQSIPAKVSDEIMTISHKATTDANKSVMAYSLLFTVMGLIATFWLPEVSTEHVEHVETVEAVPAARQLVS